MSKESMEAAINQLFADPLNDFMMAYAVVTPNTVAPEIFDIFQLAQAWCERVKKNPMGFGGKINSSRLDASNYPGQPGFGKPAVTAVVPDDAFYAADRGVSVKPAKPDAIEGYAGSSWNVQVMSDNGLRWRVECSRWSMQPIGNIDAIEARAVCKITAAALNGAKPRDEPGPVPWDREHRDVAGRGEEHPLRTLEKNDQPAAPTVDWYGIQLDQYKEALVYAVVMMHGMQRNELPDGVKVVDEASGNQVHVEVQLDSGEIVKASKPTAYFRQRRIIRR